MGKRLNGHLKVSQIKTLKVLLEDEKQRILSSVSDKKNDYLDGLDTSNKDDVDSANDNILLSHSMRFSNREMLYLKKIKKTLNHIESEEFGMCDDCGDPISFERLRARPTSNMCIVCKEDSESKEKQNFHLRQSKSLGKSISFS